MNFPSDEHLTFLRQKLRNAKFQSSAFTETERCCYVAYDYAFNLVLNGEETAALDPDRQYHNTALVQRAKDFYVTRYRKPVAGSASGIGSKYDEPWFRNADEPTRLRIAEQDLARQDARRAVEHEASADTYSPAKQAFVALCVRQVRENAAAYGTRNAAAFADAELPVPAPHQHHLTRDEANAALQRLRESLGVWSAESVSPPPEVPLARSPLWAENLDPEIEVDVESP
jgi:hypothetical protein